MQITYTAYAWLDMKYTSLEAVKKGAAKPFLDSDAPGAGSYFERAGYAPIGTATVTLTIHSDDEIVVGQIAALNAQLESVRAESQQKENAILLQISNLQALTMA